MRRTITLVLVLLITAPAFAWNGTGHGAVAAIAADVLGKEHPATLAKVVAILKGATLPQFDDRVKKLRVPAGEEAKGLLIAAARWPDDVKRKKGVVGFSHPTWHYIDYPLAPAGDPTTGPQPGVPNALSALEGQSTVLKGNNPAQDKAVAVCWIAHLVGDLHQPLHTASMFTREDPNGDGGGNGTYITFPGRDKPVALHTVWDGLLGNADTFRDAANIATELQARPGFAAANMPEAADLDPARWAKDSNKLALEVAYLNGTLHGGSKTVGLPVPADYGSKSKAVGERQVVLAGRRLAAMLVKVIGE